MKPRQPRQYRLRIEVEATSQPPRIEARNSLMRSLVWSSCPRHRADEIQELVTKYAFYVNREYVNL